MIIKFSTIPIESPRMKSLSIILAAGAMGAGIAGAAVFFKTRMQGKTSPRSPEELCMQEAVSRATWQDILDHADCPPTGGKDSKGIRCCCLSVVDMRTDPRSTAPRTIKSGSSATGTVGLGSSTVDESGSSETKTVSSTPEILRIGPSIDTETVSSELVDSESVSAAPESGSTVTATTRSNLSSMDPMVAPASCASEPVDHASPAAANTAQNELPSEEELGTSTTSCSASGVVKDKVVFVCKIKKGCMGRIIGKKGRKLKQIKSELHVDFMHGTLDEKYSFLRLEGAADDVDAAKSVAYQSIQTGIVEIAPSDIEDRVVNDDDIVTENLYHIQTQHGRIVGQNGINLKLMRSLGVAVSTSTEHHLKVLTIKGTPEKVHDVHKWIKNNIAEKNLFVPAPGLSTAVPDQWSGNALAIESASSLPPWTNSNEHGINNKPLAQAQIC